MDIRFYNTLTRRVEVFQPVTPGVVRMYHCGPTVYDYAHIGNFRSFLLGDLLRRFFEFVGFRVDQVMNITDVGHMTEDDRADGGGQDKMELAAQRLKQAKKQGAADVDNPDDPYRVAQFFIEAFLEDAKLLGMKVADEYPQQMPRATENVNRMIEQIGRLIEAGHAYLTDVGAVYYDVASFPDYGKLSGNTDLAQLNAGAGGRVLDEHQQGKRHPADFLLWKHDEKHLMKWDSPWGVGYPGWHIECSAMALGTLGVDTLDIHTGGEDNIFPHHECEIAQATGATGKPFANYWLHARHLFVEGEKMSKSKGNFHTLRDLMQRGVDPAVLRFALLGAPYRQNANFTFKGLEDAEKQVRRLRGIAPPAPQGAGVQMGDSAVERAFADALADDLNISAALGELNKWMGAVHTSTADDAAIVQRIDGVLGVLHAHQSAKPPAAEGPGDAELDALCRQMHQARMNKDYAESDAIRDQLTAAGIEVQISKDRVTWRRKMKLD